MSVNKLMKVNEALAERSFTKGLSRYTQANCQVTITENGYRIYRPPNITYNSSDSSTRTMWGGLILQPFTDDANFLIQNHTYIMLFHVKGKTSVGVTGVYWSNNAGWVGDSSNGLTTDRSTVVFESLPANFQGEKDIYVKFSVPDAINKKCTTSYSTFTAGTTYNCYRDFKWGFDYGNTGSLGTDLYLTNFRMYDVTSVDSTGISILKAGVVNATNIVEGCSTAAIRQGGELQVSNIVEC